MQSRRLLFSYSIFFASNLRSCASFTLPLGPHFTSIRLSTDPNLSLLKTSRFSTETTASTTKIKSSATPLGTMSTETDSKTSASIRVVSYNILSSELAEPDYHTKCEPENLDASNRLPRILDKLGEEIDASSEIPLVFCLQEVSHEWATSLHVFFAEKGYHMVTGLYGRKFNGYMGIATAYPTKHFETLKVDLVRLSDKKRWPRKPKEPEPSKLRKYVFDPIYGPMKAVYRHYRPQKRFDDAWDYSKFRHNQFIALKIKNRGEGHTPFWVGNYHMPCAFRTPGVMNIHADLVGSRIQQLAGEDPFILSGDFNILPESSHYTLLTTGTIDKEDETYPDKKYDVDWAPTLKGMRSAYFEKNKKEPEFTNNAHNGALNAESFIGTLDYIFLSDEWKVLEVKDTPKKEELSCVYPSAEEPSDHVLIAASLSI